MKARSEISTSFDKALGGKIRSCRRSMGFSQCKLLTELIAYGVELDQRQLRKIEKGERTVYPLELVCLTQILNIDLAVFMIQTQA